MLLKFIFVILLLSLIACFLVVSYCNPMPLSPSNFQLSKHISEIASHKEALKDSYWKQYVEKYTQKSVYPLKSMEHFKDSIHQIEKEMKVKTFKNPPNNSKKGIILFCTPERSSLLERHIDFWQRLHCSLPVQIWSTETLEHMPFPSFNVNDFYEEETDNIELLKVRSILACSFDQVLMLYDSVCIENPMELFEHSEFKRTGCMFWSSPWKLDENAPIFNMSKVSNDHSYCYTSRVLIVDKFKCISCLWFLLRVLSDCEKELPFVLPLPIDVQMDQIWSVVWNLCDEPFSLCSSGVDFVGSLKRSNGVVLKDFNGKDMFFMMFPSSSMLEMKRRWSVDRKDPSSWVHPEFEYPMGKSVRMSSPSPRLKFLEFIINAKASS